MKTHVDDQTKLPKQQETGFHASSLKAQELLSVPIGTFAGTQDRIIRTRDGRSVPADTGDQGGGQN